MYVIKECSLISFVAFNFAYNKNEANEQTNLYIVNTLSKNNYVAQGMSSCQTEKRKLYNFDLETSYQNQWL